jgi:hypothetical protein
MERRTGQRHEDLDYGPTSCRPFFAVKGLQARKGGRFSAVWDLLLQPVSCKVNAVLERRQIFEIL